MQIQNCDACSVGDHAHHKRVVQAAPKGMLGGVTCECRGECVDDPNCTEEKYLERLLGPSVVAVIRSHERGAR